MPKFDVGEYWLRSLKMVCMPATAWDKSSLNEEVMSQATTTSQCPAPAIAEAVTFAVFTPIAGAKNMFTGLPPADVKETVTWQAFAWDWDEPVSAVKVRAVVFQVPSTMFELGNTTAFPFTVFACAQDVAKLCTCAALTDSPRAPARAAASATACAWVWTTQTLPMSTDNATMPKRTAISNAARTDTTPRREFPNRRR